MAAKAFVVGILLCIGGLIEKIKQSGATSAVIPADRFAILDYHSRIEIIKSGSSRILLVLQFLLLFTLLCVNNGYLALFDLNSLPYTGAELLLKFFWKTHLIWW